MRDKKIHMPNLQLELSEHHVLYAHGRNMCE